MREPGDMLQWVQWDVQRPDKYTNHSWMLQYISLLVFPFHLPSPPSSTPYFPLATWGLYLGHRLREAKGSTSQRQPQEGNPFSRLIQNWPVAQWAEGSHQKLTTWNVFECLKITICTYINFPRMYESLGFFNGSKKSMGPIEPDTWGQRGGGVFHFQVILWLQLPLDNDPGAEEVPQWVKSTCCKNTRTWIQIPSTDLNRYGFDCNSNTVEVETGKSLGWGLLARKGCWN